MKQRSRGAQKEKEAKEQREIKAGSEVEREQTEVEERRSKIPNEAFLHVRSMNHPSLGISEQQEGFFELRDLTQHLLFGLCMAWQ